MRLLVIKKGVLPGCAMCGELRKEVSHFLQEEALEKRFQIVLTESSNSLDPTLWIPVPRAPTVRVATLMIPAL